MQHFWSTVYRLFQRVYDEKLRMPLTLPFIINHNWLYKSMFKIYQEPSRIFTAVFSNLEVEKLIRWILEPILLHFNKMFAIIVVF